MQTVLFAPMISNKPGVWVAYGFDATDDVDVTKRCCTS